MKILFFSCLPYLIWAKMHILTVNLLSHKGTVMNQEILLLGGDRRQDFLLKFLQKSGQTVQDYRRLPASFASFASPLSLIQPEEAAPLKEAVSQAHWILAPLPFTKDQKNLFIQPEAGETDVLPCRSADSPSAAFSKAPSAASAGAAPRLSIGTFLSWLKPGQTLFGAGIPSAVQNYCLEHQIACVDALAQPSAAEKNAMLTAEGAICCAIQESPGALHRSVCLVAGYGRCGQALARKLKGLGARVTIMEQDPQKLELARCRGFSCLPGKTLPQPEELLPFSYLFNTIPAPIFGQRLLTGTKQEITIIDIASAPGGVDFDFCRESGRTALLCPGLPGRFSPEAAARILYDVLISLPDFPAGKGSPSAAPGIYHKQE